MASLLHPPLAPELPLPATARDFWALLKPRVVSLVVFTGLVGLIAAPGRLDPVLAFSAVLCIALGAGGSAALNQWYEADLDARMKRTRNRPLPAGRMERSTALQFGVGLSVFSVALMGLATNWLAAAILALSIVYYAVVYTMWLKPRTPHNIVIGGGAGAFPPLIGWVAVTGQVEWMPMLLFAIIFLWTPPHFWALSLFMKSDYAAAGIPMLPVVRGEAVTRRQIGLYTVALAAAAVAPWLLGLTGIVYGVAAIALSAGFAVAAWPVATRRTALEDAMRPEKRLFAYSIVYLFALFGAVALDALVRSGNGL